MAGISSILSFFDDWAPKTGSESWDNDGVMFCADPSREVSRVAVALEINRRVLDEAASFGAELIITHHPFIFRPKTNVAGDDYADFRFLFEHHIDVLSFHTRLDCAPGGVNDTLASRLGLRDVTSFGGESGGLGRVGTLFAPMTAKAFGEHLKKTLGTTALRAAYPADGGEEAPVRRVALVGGGGKDFLHEAMEVADAYVTADLSHNSFIDASANGLALYDAGHYYTENPVTETITARLTAAFPELLVERLDAGCPYTEI